MASGKAYVDDTPAEQMKAEREQVSVCNKGAWEKRGRYLTWKETAIEKGGGVYECVTRERVRARREQVRDRQTVDEKVGAAGECNERLGESAEGAR